MKGEHERVRSLRKRHRIEVIAWTRVSTEPGQIVGLIAVALAEAGLDVDVSHASADERSARIVQDEEPTL